ncbi:MAG: HAD family acid phosphatase [Sphingomonas sp.]|jgi:5'-nucleotidase (lipoprotein e(P4) family)|uniref:HAD family acid phosphatase n=1 Tax=Sphingomonas sp. TaxID=28214 RepID=UPI0035615228
MKRTTAALILCSAAWTMSGCVAAVAPIAAAAMIGKKQLKHNSAPDLPGAATQAAATPPAAAAAPTAAPAPLAAPQMAAPAPVTTAPTPTPAVAPAGISPGMQFLYGSGEGAAISVQAYRGLIDMMIARSSDRAVGLKVWSAVLTPDATLAAPKFEDCGSKPLAVVLDVDETSLLNLGFEADEAQRSGSYDPARWDRWEKTGMHAVVATPGIIEAAKIAKTSGVTMVYNSNRLASNAAETAAALDGAGLGPVTHLKNLWLQGDEGTGSGKDARRHAIAAKYCVIAMVGDQLGDFSDLFNNPGMTPTMRRAAIDGEALRTIWGHGWFILPNPVYGTALKGGLDDAFPADKRWTDPGPAPAPAGAPPQ